MNDDSGKSAASVAVDAAYGRKAMTRASQNVKREIRNPKFETNANDQNGQNSKRARFEFRYCSSVCFGFRYSDFGFSAE